MHKPVRGSGGEFAGQKDMSMPPAWLMQRIPGGRNFSKVDKMMQTRFAYGLPGCTTCAYPVQLCAGTPRTNQCG
jgi:hypothetical protein